MASGLPNDHRKTTERSEKKTFVFGSSTPRDLSHMYSVPAMLRTYDSKIKPVKRAKDLTLSYYMRQARSVTRNQSGKEQSRPFSFENK
uniref:Ovule protein n=1 Tax=Loa loa TaxID=7209 RepID=A0A1I7VTJ3_LOALO